MTFRTLGDMFFKAGTEKAHVVFDHYNRKYFIPKSVVKVVEQIEPETEFDSTAYIVEIPNWIINKNSIPIFDLDCLVLVR